MRIILALSLLLSLAACGTASAPTDDEHASSSTDEALTTVPASANAVYGIDVSHYQGTVNWSAEKAKGRLFGVASVGDGLYQDPTFATNWAGMKAAGVIRGAYQFFEPGADPIQQANILIAKVGKLGVDDLPATIDVEATGGQSPATIATRVGQWLARVEAGTGKKPMIYTGPYFWQDHVASSAFGSYPLWIADYGVTSPQLPAPWTKFKIWQYSSSNGVLDLDRFNGTLAELKLFAGAPPSVKAPPPPKSDAGTPHPASDASTPSTVPNSPTVSTPPGDSASPSGEEPGAAASDDAPATGNGGCQLVATRTTSDASVALAAVLFACLLGVRRRAVV